MKEKNKQTTVATMMAYELERVSQVIGKKGNLRQRARFTTPTGA